MSDIDVKIYSTAPGNVLNAKIRIVDIHIDLFFFFSLPTLPFFTSPHPGDFERDVSEEKNMSVDCYGNVNFRESGERIEKKRLVAVLIRITPGGKAEGFAIF